MSWRLPVVGVSLLAVAVLAAGAGSAQAANTTICTTSNLSLICPPAFRRPSGQVYKAVATGTNAIQTSSGESVSCTGSTIEFKTLLQLGSPLPAEVTGWTVSGCTDTTHSVSCSTALFGAQPYDMSIQWTGSDHGSLLVTGTFSHNPIFKYVCGPMGATILCAWETPEIKLETSSLTPAVASMSAIMTLISGNASCGTVSKLLGNFTFTSPSPGSFFVEHD
jgi:hypothetical protein